jgi:hypothetical protein
MKPYEIYLNESFTLKKLLETYLELRQHFQELGFSEDQLEKPPTYTPNMMRLFSKWVDERDTLLKDVNSYGFDMSFDELTTYLTPLLKKINELTPLKENGNNQRSNRWD